MRYLDSIKEVTYGLVKLNNEMSLIGLNNEFFIKDKDDQIIKFPFQVLENQTKKITDKYLYYQEGKICFRVDFDTLSRSVFYEINSDFEIWICNDDYIFLAKRTEIRREYEFSLVNLRNDKIKWSDKSMIRYFSKDDNQLLFTDFLGEIYKKRSVENGDEIWTLDFSENRINGNIHLINNVLVFPTTTQDLIGIEIETGIELWRLKNIIAGFFQVQPKTNYLISLNANSAGNNWYHVIDPLNGEKLIDKKFDNFFYDAMGSKACITETHYYFISNVVGDGGQKDERITHLGCINLQTHEIEWIEKIGTTSDRYSSYQKPEFHNNKMYLLDGDQTLHIYEL